MKTIEVTSSVGKEYGHVPGNHYKDVDVTITRTRPDRWVVHILETWGSCQGHDEEHGRKTVKALGPTLEMAVAEAARRAEAAGLHRSYTTQALSCAEAEAAEEEEALEAEALEAARSGPAANLSEVPAERLLAELRARGVTAIA